MYCKHIQCFATGAPAKPRSNPSGKTSADQSVQCDPLPEHDLMCLRNRQACGPRMLVSGPLVQSGMSATSEIPTVHAVSLDRSVCVFLLRDTRRCRNSENLAASSLGRLCQARFRDMAQCEFVTTGGCASVPPCRRAAFGTPLAAGVPGKVCVWNCRCSAFRLALEATGSSDLVRGQRSGSPGWPMLPVPCDAQPLGGAVLAFSTVCVHRLATD